MNKTIAAILFILFSMGASMILPWYTIALLALLFAYMGNYKPIKAFLTFLIIGFLIWFLSAYLIDHTASSRLSNKIAVLFGNQKVTTLLVLTGLIGGITSALGAWSGSILRKYINS